MKRLGLVALWLLCLVASAVASIWMLLAALAGSNRAWSLAIAHDQLANSAFGGSEDETIALTKMLGRALGIAGTGASLSARAHGATTGTETHVLTTAEMPSHTHTINASINSNRATSSGGSEGIMSQLSTSNTQSQGGGGAHNNMQPTTFLNAMIKL